MRHGIDTTTASDARMWDWTLGGFANYARDRRAGEKLLELAPDTAVIAQLLDLAGGVPNLAADVNAIARALAPSVRLVHVDRDPLAHAHTRSIQDDGNTSALLADMTDIDTILDHPVAGDLILPGRPTAAATRALANRVPQGYASTDPSWSRLLDTAIDDSRFTRLRELYDRHRDGEVIGHGPGADKLTAAFDTITRATQTTRTAKAGDRRTEYDLLRKARVSLRFGKLNHCTFDPDDPAGAKCLEGTDIPPGHTGPLIDRCRPDRCHNSVLAPEHLTIWRSEEMGLLTLLESPGVAPCRREQLERQLDDVRSVLRRAQG
nr:SAM-dependent methyltransferase [Streptomyces sp. SID3343]